MKAPKSRYGTGRQLATQGEGAGALRSQVFDHGMDLRIVDVRRIEKKGILWEFDLELRDSPPMLLTLKFALSAPSLFFSSFFFPQPSFTDKSSPKCGVGVPQHLRVGGLQDVFEGWWGVQKKARRLKKSTASLELSRLEEIDITPDSNAT